MTRCQHVPAEELAAHLTGEDADNNEALEDGMEMKYGLDMATFEVIVNDLLPLVFPIRNELSGRYYHAFGKFDTLPGSPQTFFTALTQIEAAVEIVEGGAVEG